MREAVAATDWDVTYLVCDHEQPDMVCSPADVEFVKCDDTDPLTEKANKLMSAALKHRPDWYLYTGDDDLVCPRFLKAYEPYMPHHDYITWRDIYFYTNSRHGRSGTQTQLGRRVASLSRLADR
jgi:hypothetical protein